MIAAEFERLRKRSQRALIGFLRADLNLAFTFCNTARIEKTLEDREGYEQAVGKAVKH